MQEQSNIKIVKEFPGSKEYVETNDSALKKVINYFKFFYINNIRYRKIRYKAIVNHEKRKAKKENTHQDNHYDNDYLKEQFKIKHIFPGNLPINEKIQEMNFTMNIIKDSIESFYKIEDDEEKLQAFYDFIESVQLNQLQNN